MPEPFAIFPFDRARRADDAIAAETDDQHGRPIGQLCDGQTGQTWDRHGITPLVVVSASRDTTLGHPDDLPGVGEAPAESE